MPKKESTKLWRGDILLEVALTQYEVQSLWNSGSNATQNPKRNETASLNAQSTGFWESADLKKKKKKQKPELAWEKMNTAFHAYILPAAFSPSPPRFPKPHCLQFHPISLFLLHNCSQSLSSAGEFLSLFLSLFFFSDSLFCFNLLRS